MLDVGEDRIRKILYDVGGNHCNVIEDMLIETIRHASTDMAADMIRDGRLSSEAIAECLDVPLGQINELAVSMMLQ